MARTRLFGSKQKTRSTKRIREYYRKLKSFRVCVISSIVNRDTDSRPYINLKIFDTVYFALLDNGANKSVIGGKLAKQVQENNKFHRCKGNVRTADGQSQNVLGTITLDIT